MTNLYSQPINVTRNNVTLPHPWTDYKKGPKKDKEKYPGVNIEKTQEAFDKFVQFYSFENLYESTMATYTVLCQQAHNRILEELEKAVEAGALEKDSPAYIEQYTTLFTKDMTALETRRETIGDLEDANKALGVQIADIVNQMAALSSSGVASDQLKAVGLIVDMKKLSDQVTKNNLAIASKQRKKSTDEEEAVEAVTH